MTGQVQQNCNETVIRFVQEFLGTQRPRSRALAKTRTFISKRRDKCFPSHSKPFNSNCKQWAPDRYELGVRVPPDKSEDGKSQMKLRNGQNELASPTVRSSRSSIGSPRKMPRATTSTSAPRAEPTHPDRRSDSQQPRHAPIDTGYTPACVVETSPGNFQAWLKHAWTLTAQEGTVAAKILAERFGGDPNSADWRHFGRLAGFTNPKPQYRLPNGLFPYSQLKFALSKGVIYEKTHEVLSEVEDRLLEQYDGSRRGLPRHASAFRNIPGRNLNFSTTPTSPTYFPLKVNGTKQIFPMPPTHSSEASPEIEIRDTIRAHTSTSAFVNRSQRDKDAYIDRTVRKALKQNGISIPMQPTLQTAELCR